MPATVIGWLQSHCSYHPLDIMATAAEACAGTFLITSAAHNDIKGVLRHSLRAVLGYCIHQITARLSADARRRLPHLERGPAEQDVIPPEARSERTAARLLPSTQGATPGQAEAQQSD